jgi:hypothetical protein
MGNIDSKTVNKEIKKYIIPILKEHGFQVFTNRTAWRDNGIKIDIVNFQSFNSYLAESLGCTSFSFAINLGVYIKCIPNLYINCPFKVRSNIICPDESASHIRRSLNKTLEQDKYLRENIWFVDENGGNLNSVITDASNVIVSDAFSWFDRFDNYEEVLRTLVNDDEKLFDTFGFGRNPSPRRNYCIGYISLAIGDYKLAESSLIKYIDSDCPISEQLTKDYNFALAQKLASENSM